MTAVQLSSPAAFRDAACVETGAGGVLHPTVLSCGRCFLRRRYLKLAICGTVNDLAVAGARPQVLSTALILEEGFCAAPYWRRFLRVLPRPPVRRASASTGDTKVVEKGAADGLFINTAGIGLTGKCVAWFRTDCRRRPDSNQWDYRRSWDNGSVQTR